MTPPSCRNCDAPLTGPYCARCGQSTRHSARSLGALLHDAWHVLTHLDGRFWSTLGLLLGRPGALTGQYFAERRARYVPPVRLYLAASILFFGLSSLTSRPASVEVDASQALATARAELALREQHGGAGLTLDSSDCEKVWSSVHWLEQPIRAACRRNVADHGATLIHAFRANVPKMMFVFLPLVAAVMLLLYWVPRRYYVEHLVFVLHNHAALFLAMTLPVVLSAIGRLLPAAQRAARLAGIALVGYAVWYVYRAMRRYYGQGRMITVLKVGAVGIAYLAFLGVTLVGTLLASALAT